MIAVRCPGHEPVYVPESILNKESPVFKELIDRTQNTLLLENNTDPTALLIWLASITMIVEPETVIKGDLMAGVLCISFAFHYRLFDFHNRVMRHIGMAIGRNEVGSFVKYFFRPKFDKAPIKQRLVDIIVMEADGDHPFGPLNAYDLGELDGTGFLVKFYETVKEVKELGHLPPRVWDQWKPEDLEQGAEANGGSRDER